jgi:hypothetical protein
VASFINKSSSRIDLILLHLHNFLNEKQSNLILKKSKDLYNLKVYEFPKTRNSQTWYWKSQKTYII